MAKAKVVAAPEQDMPLSKESAFLFTQVDEVVEQSLAAGDPRLAFAYGRALIERGQITGVVLAKLLTEMKKVWDTFQAAGVDDDFTSVVFSEMGVPSSTTKKYINMWEAVLANEALPAVVRGKLMGKPVETLLLLTGAAKEGSFSEKEWYTLADAPDKSAVRDMIHQKRGENTSAKTAIHITLEDDGSLFARKGRGGKKVPLGLLRVSEEDMRDEVRSKAIHRIVNAAGIQWR